MHLLDEGVVAPQPMIALEAFYSKRILALKPIQEATKDRKAEQDRLLVGERDGKQLGELLQAPKIAMEVERAVIQIRQEIESLREGEKEKFS